MKGIVFNLLEEVVRREHGIDAWEALLEASGVSGAYTSLGSYPDAELYLLVGAASQALGADAGAIVQWFGREALPLFAAHYPEFFAPHTGARAFVLTLNDIIHPEVRKLYPGANVPDFDFVVSEPGHLQMTYRSRRHLCAFAEGLLQGAATHYGEHAEISQTSCMHRGDDVCVLEIDFTPKSVPAAFPAA